MIRTSYSAVGDPRSDDVCHTFPPLSPLENKGSKVSCNRGDPSELQNIFVVAEIEK